MLKHHGHHHHGHAHHPRKRCPKCRDRAGDRPSGLCDRCKAAMLMSFGLEKRKDFYRQSGERAVWVQCSYFPGSKLYTFRAPKHAVLGDFLWDAKNRKTVRIEAILDDETIAQERIRFGAVRMLKVARNADRSLHHWQTRSPADRRGRTVRSPAVADLDMRLSLFTADARKTLAAGG